MITKLMYSRAVRFQEEKELLPIVYTLNAWLKIIEDDFRERNWNDIPLNKHPVVILLAHKMFSLVFPSSVKNKPSDLRMIPSVYLQFLAKWLLNVLNDYTCESSLIIVDNHFLNFDQLVQWIVTRIAEITYCMDASTAVVARIICNEVMNKSEEDVYKCLQSDLSLHCINTLQAPLKISSQKLFNILQTFQTLLEDVICTRMYDKSFLHRVDKPKDLTMC